MPDSSHNMYDDLVSEAQSLVTNRPHWLAMQTIADEIGVSRNWLYQLLELKPHEDVGYKKLKTLIEYMKNASKP